MKYGMFAGNNHYPKGGACDFVAQSYSINVLKNMLKSKIYEIAEGSIDTWAHIVEMDTMQVVAEVSHSAVVMTAGAPTPVWTDML